jgi:F0F1-type ATP synthase membrane subunit b/b'
VFHQLLEEAEKEAQSQLEAAEHIAKTVVEPIKPQAKAKVQHLRRVCLGRMWQERGRLGIGT